MRLVADRDSMGERSPGRSRVVAVLGPTNTGKTHLAIERMLGHASGMIGFPLRLLARENYDRIVRLKGRHAVALVTGEERIVPAHPAYFVCTVEAMALDREVAFLAIDEVQMAGDRERGHVFTDRLLHARGYAETMLLGAETAKPLIRKLIPGVEFIARPRFSELSYVGPKKITRLPHRSAVVAFSASEVYAIAELVRRQRGGAAVVFGALSPRTRNAQVAMYQAGEVDYLVATDAIGMGLNMDIDHVAFAALSKFDGRAPRRLLPAELAQIAGRAGRHMSNGTFGTTAEVGPLDPEMIEAVETHRFPPLTAFYWRSRDLDFRSAQALLRSLEARPPTRELIRVREADDHLALEALARDPDIAQWTAAGGAPLRLLWEVCQIPDFRKVISEAHTRLLSQVYRHLRGQGRLAEDWVAAQVARLDRTDGDIETLLARIAHVRTWTYVAHRPDWLADSGHWQERTRGIEDRLSDALHERLTQRFVDRRAAAISRRLGAGEGLLSSITQAGEVLVEGEVAGRLEGFRFVPEAGPDEGGRAVAAAANQAIRADIGRRVRRFVAEADEAFTLDPQGRLRWEGQAVARLVAGDSLLSPRVEPLSADLLEPAHRDQIRRRLAGWVAHHLGRELGPLVRLQKAPLKGPARGLAYELVEALGTLPRGRVEALVASLDRRTRAHLDTLAVTLGAAAVFVRKLNRASAVALRGLLWAIAKGVEASPPAPSRASLVVDPALPPGFLLASGFLCVGRLALRADRLEDFAKAAADLAAAGKLGPSPELARLIGGEADDVVEALRRLGYRPVSGADGVRFVRARERPRRGRRGLAGEAGSPFAELKRLVVNA